MVEGMDSKNHKTLTGKRPAPVSYRPPVALSDEFYVRAKNSGLSINGFITQSIFERASGKSVMDKKLLALLLSQAARINGHLEEVGHSSSDTQNFLILEECRHELAEIRAALLASMGKRL